MSCVYDVVSWPKVLERGGGEVTAHAREYVLTDTVSQLACLKD